VHRLFSAFNSQKVASISRYRLPVAASNQIFPKKFKLEVSKMDGQHPNIFDKRPKRRKDKDNPYELFTVGIGTPEPLYFIRFKR